MKGFLLWNTKRSYGIENMHIYFLQLYKKLTFKFMSEYILWGPLRFLCHKPFCCLLTCAVSHPVIPSPVHHLRVSYIRVSWSWTEVKSSSSTLFHLSQINHLYLAENATICSAWSAASINPIYKMYLLL